MTTDPFSGSGGRPDDNWITRVIAAGGKVDDYLRGLWAPIKQEPAKGFRDLALQGSFVRARKFGDNHYAELLFQTRLSTTGEEAMRQFFVPEPLDQIGFGTVRSILEGQVDDSALEFWQHFNGVRDDDNSGFADLRFAQSIQRVPEVPEWASAAFALKKTLETAVLGTANVTGRVKSSQYGAGHNQPVVTSSVYIR